MKLSTPQIEEALGCLDADKIVEHMTAVDHVWAFSGEPWRVPTAAEIRDEARRLLSRLSWYNAAGNVHNVGTGGLFACLVLDGAGEPCGARVGFEVSAGECWWTAQVAR